MVCSPVFKDAGDDDRALAIFAKHRARVVELFLDLCVDRPIEGPGPLDDAILPLFALFVSTRSDALRSRFFHKVAQLNPDGVAHCLHLAAEAGDASTAAHCITWFSEGENRGIRTYSAAALARYLAGFMPDAWKLVLYDVFCSAARGMTTRQRPGTAGSTSRPSSKPATKGATQNLEGRSSSNGRSTKRAGTVGDRRKPSSDQPKLGSHLLMNELSSPSR